MCIFHKWSKWEQYDFRGISYGFFWQNNKEGREFSERRQKRTCKKCGKEQDELVLPS
jgi:hypothetical protein